MTCRSTLRSFLNDATTFEDENFFVNKFISKESGDEIQLIHLFARIELSYSRRHVRVLRNSASFGSNPASSIAVLHTVPHARDVKHIRFYAPMRQIGSRTETGCLILGHLSHGSTPHVKMTTYHSKMQFLCTSLHASR
jgi:hypothetical protein